MYIQPLNLTIPDVTTDWVTSTFFPKQENKSLLFSHEPIKKEIDGVYTLKYKLPGYEKNEIKISFDSKPSYTNRTVTVTAFNKEYGNEKFVNLVHASIDEKSVKANLKNGILTLSYTLEKVKNPLASIKIEEE